MLGHGIPCFVRCPNQQMESTICKMLYLLHTQPPLSSIQYILCIHQLDSVMIYLYRLHTIVYNFASMFVFIVREYRYHRCHAPVVAPYYTKPSLGGTRKDFTLWGLPIKRTKWCV